MNIETAKTLRIGDRLKYTQPGNLDTGSVVGIYPQGVDIQWGNYNSGVWGFTLGWAHGTCTWGYVELVGDSAKHAKKTEVIRQLKAAKVGDNIRLSSVKTDRPGIITAIDADSVTFDFYRDGSDGSAATWHFNQDLTWDLLTVIPAPTSVDIGLYENLQCENKKIADLLTATKRTNQELMRQVKESDASWRELVEASEGLKQQAKNWEESAALFHRNEQYYRDLLLQIAEVLGPEKFVCDSGDVSDEVLVAKIPELARAAILDGVVLRHNLDNVPSPYEVLGTQTGRITEIPCDPVTDNAIPLTGVGQMKIDASNYPQNAQMVSDAHLLRECGCTIVQSFNDGRYEVEKDGKRWLAIISR